MAKRSVTERDQFWLDHEAALAGSGLTTKEYAAEHGLSFHAFYQARKRLRALGLLPPADQKRKPTKKPVGSMGICRPFPRCLGLASVSGTSFSFL